MFRKRESSHLELEVDRAIRELKNHAIGSEEYMKTLGAIVDLHKMKETEKPAFVSRDTLAIIGANLLGIIMIIRAEHAHVISRNAMQMMLRPRV